MATCRPLERSGRVLREGNARATYLGENQGRGGPLRFEIADRRRTAPETGGGEEIEHRGPICDF